MESNSIMCLKFRGTTSISCVYNIKINMKKSSCLMYGGMGKSHRYSLGCLLKGASRELHNHSFLCLCIYVFACVYTYTCSHNNSMMPSLSSTHATLRFSHARNYIHKKFIVKQV